MCSWKEQPSFLRASFTRSGMRFRSSVPLHDVRKPQDFTGKPLCNPVTDFIMKPGWHFMMTSWHGSVFCITGTLWMESCTHLAGHRVELSVVSSQISFQWLIHMLFEDHFAIHCGWQHTMENLSALLAICVGNPPVTNGSLTKGW